MKTNVINAKRSMVVCLAVLVWTTRVHAQSEVIVNPAFDSNDLSGWTTHGNVAVAEHPNAPGDYFALLRELGDELVNPTPAAGALSQMWQTFPIPAGPSYLAFRYRFTAGDASARPTMTDAVSRKYHPVLNELVDLNVLSGQTECRSENLGGLPAPTTTDLEIVVIFDRRINLLGLTGGDVTTDHGTIVSTLGSHDELDIQIIDVDLASKVNLRFPGVVDWEFGRPELFSQAELCVVVAIGDYDSDGQTTQADIDAVNADILLPATVTVDTARADWNLDGQIDSLDETDLLAAIPQLPGADVGCPFGRTLEPSSPPDSFMALLVDNAVPTNLPVGLSLAEPTFANAFLYQDSNGRLLFDETVIEISEELDEDGMFSVSLSLAGVAAQDARLAFSLYTAGNGVTSGAAIDDLHTVCPAGWCCHPVTGAGELIDDNNACTDEICDTATGVVNRTPGVDTEAPVITCPAEAVVRDSAMRGPEFTGYATATDNCSEPTISDPPVDNVHLGCPTVIQREWTATDAGGNTASCIQVITDLDSDAPYYQCLADRLQQCFQPPALEYTVHLSDRVTGVCDGGIPNCSCSVAELFTECFKKVVSGEISNVAGQIQSQCVVPLVETLITALLVQGNDGGQIKSCTANNIHELYNWIVGTAGDTNFEACDGGPEGTEPCDTAGDCNDFNATNYDCCERTVVTDEFGWCTHGAIPCSP